jgi:hypothetical protein
MKTTVLTLLIAVAVLTACDQPPAPTSDLAPITSPRPMPRPTH